MFSNRAEYARTEFEVFLTLHHLRVEELVVHCPPSCVFSTSRSWTVKCPLWTAALVAQRQQLMSAVTDLVVASGIEMDLRIKVLVYYYCLLLHFHLNAPLHPNAGETSGNAGGCKSAKVYDSESEGDGNDECGVDGDEYVRIVGGRFQRSSCK